MLRLTFSPLQADYLVTLLENPLEIADRMVPDDAPVDRVMAVHDRVRMFCDMVSSDLRTNRTLSNGWADYADVIQTALALDDECLELSVVGIYGEAVRRHAMTKLRELGMELPA